MAHSTSPTANAYLGHDHEPLLPTNTRPLVTQYFADRSLDLSEMFAVSFPRALATLALIACSHAQSPDTSTDSVAHLTVGSQCEARTINYITHSLPQSCLTNTWMSSATDDAAPSATSTDSIAASETVGAAEQQPASDTTDPGAHDASPTPFMSFEDWKEMMLKKSGQDPLAIKARKDSQQDSRMRQSQDVDNESPGDEAEAPLDSEKYTDRGADNFESQPVTSGHDDSDGNGEEQVAYDVGEPRVYRSKDAGKTCKERFSYSSFDAGATILKAGGGAKNAKAILVENKDSYMLMECATPNKYVIVELSDDVQVDTVVLANFEFFSSMIRHFRVSVSDRYPVKLEKWKDLGTFEARNTREIQAFLVENPQIWAKYIRIEFITHYSNEYYCPLSLLRIHGSRMLDSWKDTDVIDELDDVPFNQDEAVISASAQPPEEENTSNTKQNQNNPPMCTFHGNPLLYWNGTCGLVCFDVPPQLPQIESSFIDINNSYEKRHADSRQSATVSTGTFISKPTSTTTHEATPTVSSSSQTPSKQQNKQQQQQQQNDRQHEVTQEESTNIPSVTTNVEKSGGTVSTSSQAEASSTKMSGTTSSQSVNNTVSANKTNSATPASKNRSSGTSSGAASSPTVQEGFFNAITKRLQLVETNLTLSLKYMEEQSLHVQEAFNRAEKKQIFKVSSLLDHLNSTVLAELRSVRDQYDQIWQSTILALESQRDHSDRDILALSSRLNLLADEVVFQKRMAIVQAVLLLSCLLLVIFSRGVPIPYLGAPQEQGAMATAFAEILASIQKDVYGPDSPPGQRRRSKMAMQGIPHSPVSLDSSPNPISEESSPNPPSHMRENYDYQRPSPPLTPTRDETDPSLCTWSASSSSVMHSAASEQSHNRKPLPSLPEDPASPGL